MKSKKVIFVIDKLIIFAKAGTGYPRKSRIAARPSFGVSAICPIGHELINAFEKLR